MIFRLLAAAAMLALPHTAMAGPSYSSEDIEAFFSKPAKAKTRAICIGTSSACEDQETQAAADPGGFDMLITFELGSDRLSRQAQENLSEFAKALNGSALSNAQFNIEGHTDASGSNGFNLTLSNRRAESVVRFLEGLGISRERLQAQGYGESRPRVDDPFAAINRRVEATIRLQ